MVRQASGQTDIRSEMYQKGKRFERLTVGQTNHRTGKRLDRHMVWQTCARKGKRSDRQDKNVFGERHGPDAAVNLTWKMTVGRISAEKT